MEHMAASQDITSAKELTYYTSSLLDKNISLLKTKISNLAQKNAEETPDDDESLITISSFRMRMTYIYLSVYFVIGIFFSLKLLTATKDEYTSTQKLIIGLGLGITLGAALGEALGWVTGILRGR
jgi:hypothetical protein